MLDEDSIGTRQQGGIVMMVECLMVSLRLLTLCIRREDERIYASSE
jgi:hypothetical protein